MNKLTILSCLILLISVNCLGQTKAQITPAKHDSRITVLIKDSSGTLLDYIAKGLFDSGFTIDTKDQAAKTLSTKEFAFSHHSLYLKIRVSINDTSAVFTGTYAWTLTSGLYPPPHEYTPIKYWGMKKSAAMQSWNSLDLIARKFGDRIIYSK